MSAHEPQRPQRPGVDPTDDLVRAAEQIARRAMNTPPQGQEDDRHDLLPAAAEPLEPLAPAARLGVASPNPSAQPPLPSGSPGARSAPSAGGAGIRIETSALPAEASLDLDALLRFVLESGSSDLHLSVGAPPLIRLSGDVRPVSGWPTLTDTQIRGTVLRILTDAQRDKFLHEFELDFAHTLPDGNRFRGNLLLQRGHVEAVFRAIPSDVLPLDALGMPKVLYQLAALPRGLVLVTGPTGSGKSTTLAAMIDQINRTRRGHIVTVEDPIEFVHQHRACLVRQREVGSDTNSFASALKHVLRQDPDVILIGEMRDLETISVALTAAETGHLVFATLHTQSAQDTVSRVIDVFPSGQQQQIRSQLASTLKGVVCQTLVKRADGKGRVPAAEIMIVNPAIATQIRRDETHQIPQALQSGSRLGMQTLNQSLASLVNRKIVERSVAEDVTTDLKDLDNLLASMEKRSGRRI